MRLTEEIIQHIPYSDDLWFDQHILRTKNHCIGFYINGSKHSVTYTGNGTLSIGCYNLSISDWLLKLKKLELKIIIRKMKFLNMKII